MGSLGIAPPLRAATGFFHKGGERVVVLMGGRNIPHLHEKLPEALVSGKTD